MITPDITLYHYAGVLSNVESLDDLAAKMRSMERATWEAFSLMRTRTDVDGALSALCESCQPPAPMPLSRVPSTSGDFAFDAADAQAGAGAAPPRARERGPPSQPGAAAGAPAAAARGSRRLARSPARKGGTRCRGL